MTDMKHIVDCLFFLIMEETFTKEEYDEGEAALSEND